MKYLSIPHWESNYKKHKSILAYSPSNPDHTQRIRWDRRGGEAKSAWDLMRHHKWWDCYSTPLMTRVKYRKGTGRGFLIHSVYPFPIQVAMELEFVIPIERIARELCTVDEYPFEAQDGIIVKQNGRFHMWIRKWLEEYEKRFTIAHELWHIEDESIDAGFSLMAERRANSIARSILIPEEDLRKVISDLWECNVDVLSKIFGVSFEVMEKRCSEVFCIPL